MIYAGATCSVCSEGLDECEADNNNGYHFDCLDDEARRAEDERRAQGLPPRLEDLAAQSRILTAMRTAPVLT